MEHLIICSEAGFVSPQIWGMGLSIFLWNWAIS
jgi:hypothetical protein